MTDDDRMMTMTEMTMTEWWWRVWRIQYSTVYCTSTVREREREKPSQTLEKMPGAGGEKLKFVVNHHFWQSSTSPFTHPHTSPTVEFSPVQYTVWVLRMRYEWMTEVCTVGQPNQTTTHHQPHHLAFKSITASFILLWVYSLISRAITQPGAGILKGLKSGVLGCTVYNHCTHKGHSFFGAWGYLPEWSCL